MFSATGRLCFATLFLIVGIIGWLAGAPDGPVVTLYVVAAYLAMTVAADDPHTH